MCTSHSHVHQDTINTLTIQSANFALTYCSCKCEIINTPALPWSSISSLFLPLYGSRCSRRGDNWDHDEKLGAPDKTLNSHILKNSWWWDHVSSETVSFPCCTTNLWRPAKKIKRSYNIWPLALFVPRAKHVAVATLCCFQLSHQAKRPCRGFALTAGFTSSSSRRVIIVLQDRRLE